MRADILQDVFLACIISDYKLVEAPEDFFWLIRKPCAALCNDV